MSKVWIFCKKDNLWINLDHLSKISIQESNGEFDIYAHFPKSTCHYVEHIAGPFQDRNQADEYIRSLLSP